MIWMPIIPIRVLYNPPGIGSSSSVKIPKGQNEASIPLTANGSAAIGQWPFIVYAYVGGNEIASEPVMLEIADKIFNFEFPKTSTELGSEANCFGGCRSDAPVRGNLRS